MDKVTFHQLTTRPNYLKDHNLKYLEFTATIPANLSILKEIAESLPQGKRKEQINEIIQINEEVEVDIIERLSK